jgi:hypothetical protein
MEGLQTMANYLILTSQRVIPFPIVVTFYVVIGILLAAFIVSQVLAFHHFGRKKANKEQMDTNVRIFTYDYVEKTFTYFDLSNLAKQNAPMTTKAFEKSFTSEDSHEVELWLQKIVSGAKFPKYLQAEVVLGHERITRPSILEFKGISPEKHRIHFESTFLPYLENPLKASTKAKGQLKKYTLLSLPAAQEFMDDAGAVAVLGVYYVKLYRQDKKVLEKDDYLKKISGRIEEVISRFLGYDVRYLPINESESILVDRRSISQAMVMNFAATLNTSLQTCINASFADSKVTIAIGFTLGTLSSHLFETAMDQAHRMANLIASGNSTAHYLLYDKEALETLEITLKNQSDIQKVIQNQTLRLYYQATFSLASGYQDFYVLKPVPYGTSVQDLSELLKEARKCEINVSPLYGYLEERVCLTLNRVDNPNVFLELPYAEVNTFITATQEAIKRLGINRRNQALPRWILAFREDDLLTYFSDRIALRKTFQSLYDAGYRIALIFANAATSLPETLLRYASFFVLDSRFTTKLDDSKVRNSLGLVQNNYRNFTAKLTYLDLTNYDAFEIAVHYGAQILECTELSALSSHPEVLPPEKIEYLLKETRSLRPAGDEPIHSFDTSSTLVLPSAGKNV